MTNNQTPFGAQEMKVFATFDGSILVHKITHRILVREYHGSRQSKMFSICAKSKLSQDIFDELTVFDKVHLGKILPKTLVLMNETRKTKTHLVTILPLDKHSGDKEISMSLDYPHYSCYDVASRLQCFLCHGNVTVK